jgi:hypothetical protein
MAKKESGKHVKKTKRNKNGQKKIRGKFWLKAVTKIEKNYQEKNPWKLEVTFGLFRFVQGGQRSLREKIAQNVTQ